MVDFASVVSLRWHGGGFQFVRQWVRAGVVVCLSVYGGVPIMTRMNNEGFDGFQVITCSQIMIILISCFFFLTPVQSHTMNKINLVT